MIHSQNPTHPDISEGDINVSETRQAFIGSHIGPNAKPWLERDQAAFLHQSLSTPCLNVLTGAGGTLLTDADGREILDFHGNSAHQVGHAHPRVVQAIKDQLDQLPFCPRRYTNDKAVLLAERLGELTGGRLSKVLLSPGGSQAMGIAMKLARIATGRFKTISMWGAFHGASLDTISIGGEGVFRTGLGPLLPGCEHVIPCAPAHCPHACSQGCKMACAVAVEDVLARERDIGAVIVEPVRCTTVEVPPAEYLQRLRRACDRFGALLIFDEIPTCLGRTGRMFSFEHFGVVPDLLVLGKGLGGGIVPQAATLVRADLDVAAFTSLGHYTHEKSPLGCAAALATLDVIRDEGLIERAATLGETWRSRLRQAFRPHPLVREVRGLGLLIGIELDAGSTDETSEACERVLYACLREGLSFKVSDGRVLTVTPPLTVAEHDLERATAILVSAVRETQHPTKK